MGQIHAPRRAQSRTRSAHTDEESKADARAGEAMVLDSSKFQVPDSRSDSLEPETWNLKPGSISTAVKKRVKRVMWERVGILRDKDSLKRALREFEQISQANLSTSSRNFVTLAKLVTMSALWREESRGGHFRNDFPERDEKFRVHSIQKKDAPLSSSETINFTKVEN